MSKAPSDPLPPSDADFARAQRAVERGWVTKEQLEAAVAARDRSPGSGLLSHLPLSADQLRELEDPDGAAATILAGSSNVAGRTALPSEVAEAMKDPKRRVGRFVLVNLLGKGGMGMVFRGWEPELRQWVALKFLKQIGDDTARAYFKREAQLAAGLDHPNIAKIYEIGEHDGQPFIAMQYVDGEPLSTAKKEMKLEAKVDATKKIAEGVRYAHERKVIHRDLKPANVMIDKHGQVYVMDFGLAKETAVEGESLGGSSLVVGTPSYMAPEQAKGKATAQSDVYGIGAILYELVTGRPPFVGETSTDVMMQVVTQEPVWPRKLSPATPEDVEAIILHALEKDAKRRYQDAGQLIEDLEAYAQNNPLRHARRPTLGYVMGKKIRKQPLLWIFGALMVLGVLGGSAFGVYQLYQAKRSAQVAAHETRKRADQELQAARDHEEATRKQSGTQKLATLWLTIVERKQEIRSRRAPIADARKRFEKSLEEVGEYIKEWPNQPQGYYIRARGEMYLEELDKAESNARRALEVEPRFRPGWSLLGMIKVEQSYTYRLGSPDTEQERHQKRTELLKEAAICIQKGWEVGKENEEAATWGLAWSREDHVAARLAQALKEKQLSERVDGVVRMLEESRREYQAEEFLSELALLKKDPKQEIDLLTQAIQLAPGYVRAWMYRGNAKFGTGDMDGAIRDYNEVIELTPYDANAYYNLALAEDGKKDKDLDAVITNCGKAIELKKDFVDAYINRGAARYEKKEFDGAIADYDHAIRLKPGMFRAYYDRGLMKYDKGDMGGAIADLDHAIQFKQDFTEAFFLRGKAKHMRKDLEGAIADYDKAISLKSDDGDAYLCRGAARLDKGDFKGAISDFDHAIALKNDNVMRYFFRGNARRSNGDLDGAIDDYTMSIGINPEHADAFNNRGAARLEKNQLDEAIKDFTRAIEINPKSAMVYHNRGKAFQAKHDVDSAIADYTKSIEIDPDFPDAYDGQGLAKQEKGDLEGAIAAFTKAIDLRPREPEAYFYRARAKGARGDFDGAIADLDRAIARRNDYADAYASRALAKRNKGDRDGAIEDYQRALKVAPKDWPWRTRVEQAIQEQKKKP